MQPLQSSARNALTYGHFLLLPAVALSLALTAAAPAAAQCFEQALPSASGGSSDQFGSALALEGEHLFVGSSGVLTNGSNPQGRVFRYRRDPASQAWIQQQEFAPLPGTGLGRFGDEVAVDGNRLFVGAPRDDSFGADNGAVYVYEEPSPGADWTLQQYIPSMVTSAFFGYSIDAQGDVMVVGAPQEPFFTIPFNGASYVYRRVPATGQWALEERIPAPAVIAFQQFGDQVEIDGEFIVVSAPCFNFGRVDIHRFDPATGSWPRHTILAPPGATFCKFGRAVALEDGWLAISVDVPLPPSPHNGYVKLYRYNPTSDTWDLTDEVAAPDRGYAYTFAETLAFDGNRLIVGATHGPSAFVYDLDPWTRTLVLKGPLAWTGPVDTSSAPHAPALATEGGTAILGTGRLGVGAGAAQVFDDQRCNEIGVRYCAPSFLNSAGHGARIDAFGDTDLTAGLFSLRALLVPGRELGYFLASQMPAIILHPGGSDGALCLGGHILRFRAESTRSSYTGFFAHALDLSNLPASFPTAVQPGETWYFQGWFRDGTSSNFTDAVAVTFH